MSTELLGFFAAFLTTSAFFPQAYKALRERNTRAISLPMYLMFTVGVACWLAYGLILGSAPIILANALTLPPALIILICKVRNKD